MAARRVLILFCLATAELVTARAVAAGEQGCDEGWSQFGSRCFKFFKEQKSWTDAEKSCHALGANLPSVHSEEENTFIVATGGQTPTWLGGNDAVKEGNWLWSDGSPWDFTRWASGEPNNAGEEHCVHMHTNGNTWNDLPCTRVTYYICAKDVPQTSLRVPPEPKPEPKSVSLTLEGFLCQCTPNSK